MGSWLKCDCGCVLHMNLFAGANVQLLVSDAFLDRDLSERSAQHLVEEIVLKCDRLLKCTGCERLYFVDKHGTGETRCYRLVESEAT